MHKQGFKKRHATMNRDDLLEMQVTLIPHRRSKPQYAHLLYDEYNGEAQVVQCARYPQLKRVMVDSSRMLTCAPYFVLALPDGTYNQANNTFTVKYSAAWCRVTRVETHLDADAVEYLCDEILHYAAINRGLAFTFEMNTQMVAMVREIMDEIRAPLQGRGGKSKKTVDCTQVVNVIRGALRDRLEYFRIPLRSALYPFLVPDPYDDDQRCALAKCTTQQLSEMCDMLRTRPWDMVWYGPLKLHYRVHPLREEGFTKAMTPALSAQISPAMRIAISIYFRVCASQADDKHTIFSRISFADAFPVGIPLAERVALEAAVYDVLEQHQAIRWVEQPRKRFARTHHYIKAQQACQWLERIHMNHCGRALEPVLRGTRVPQLFPALTPQQADIADYVRTHWLTIVEGSPGTGKTSVITWILSHWRNVMITGFVGMLVKMLQRRNGRRVETAYTIHRLLALSLVEEHKEWFAQFEVLVVDEFSNVSMQLFTDLLSLFPNVCKLVLVGDHFQLKSFECGDPLGDMLHVFGDYCAKRLTVNLRVAPALRTLQDIPRHILDNHPERIENVAPVYFVPRPIIRDNENTIAFQACLSVLRQIVALPGGRHIMNTHCVALYNAGPDGRVVINAAMERAWAQLGIINPQHPERITVRGKFAVYPGAKIMFTHNYPPPLNVSNGELCYVRSVDVSPKKGGTIITVADSQDSDAEVKQVLIHHQQGVAPHHVYPGYASTTYTAQGREFPYVIYWCPNAATLFTQRAHTYVATSRPRLALWVVGSQLQLSAVCRVPDRERQTCFRVMLRQMRCFMDAEACCATPCVYAPSPRVPLDELVCDDNKDAPCVPVPQGTKGPKNGARSAQGDEGDGEESDE